MIVEYIRYTTTQSRSEELIQAYESGGKHLLAAPECLDFEVAQCTEDPASLVVRIRWASAEAHMQGFRRGPNFLPFLDLVRPFVGEIVEMRHYVPRIVQSAEMG